MSGVSGKAVYFVKVWISGYLGVWVSRKAIYFLKVWVTGCLGIWVSGKPVNCLHSLGYWVSGYVQGSEFVIWLGAWVSGV